MSAEPPDVLRIFNEAAEIPDREQRTAYLDGACGEDQGLRAEVEELLRHDAELGTLQDGPGGGIAAPLDTDHLVEKPGTMIGRYKLVQEIGHGGMGVVYLAEQTEPVRRQVALKVIRPGMDSHQVVSRFEIERHALAMMDHPSIARVIDGGTTESGRPYFVMELVEGAPITAYCDRERLTTDQRLELFLDVCRAVQHAHQKGIIHRDLKPSNILVTLLDGKAVPKVIDFGIAKALYQQLTDQPFQTRATQIVGTPLYMSPEQAQRMGQDLDTRTDVYSLGVLLYELLTGTTPFDKERLQGSGLEEIQRIIREEDPPTPSTRLRMLDAAQASVAEKHGTNPRTLAHELTGELDWIVMKALEKDRTRRYQSVSDFAKDVQRYLDDEPVEACPPSTTYRLKKFARKHKAGLTTALMVALALIAGAGIATWQAFVATEAKRQAQEQYERADRNLETAIAAVEEMLNQVADKDLTHVPQMESVRRTLLERALAFYERLLNETGTDPAMRLLTVRAQKRAGDILRLLGEHQGAEKHLREAIIGFEAIQAEDAHATFNQDDLADCMITLAQLIADLERNAEARVTCEQAIAIEQRLVAQFPENAEHRRLLAVSLNTLASTLRGSGKTTEAEKAYREAIDIGSKLVDESPDVLPYRSALAASYGGLALVLKQIGRYPDAEACYRDALEIRSQLAADFPREPKHRTELALCYNNLAVVLLDTGRHREAESAFLQALGIRKQLAADFPLVPSYRAAVGDCLQNMGAVLHRTARLAEPEASCRQALEVWKSLATDYPDVPDYRSRLATAHRSLGILFEQLGRSTEAEQSFREGLKIQKTLATDFPEVPEYRSGLADCLRNLGWLLENTGNKQEAEAAYREALSVSRKLSIEYLDVPTYSYDKVRGLCELGKLTGNKQEAEAIYREGLSVCRQLTEAYPDIPAYFDAKARCLHGLGNLLQSNSDPKQAEACFVEAIAINEQLSARFPDVPAYLAGVALSKMCLGFAIEKAPERLTEAEAVFRDSVRMYSRLSDDFPKVVYYRAQAADSLYYLARFLQGHDRLEEARTTLQESIAIYEQLLIDAPDHYEARTSLKRNQSTLRGVTESLLRKEIEESPEDPELRHQLGRLYTEDGLFDKALPEFDAAIRLDSENAVLYAERGDVHARLDDPDEALGDFGKAIDLDEDTATAYAGRAKLFAQLGQYEKAEADWQRALQLGDDDSEVYTDRGSCRVERGQLNDAMDDFTAAIQLDPKAALPVAERGFAYAALGEHEKAKADWEQATQLDPNIAQVYRNRAAVIRPETQIAEYTKSIHFDPNHPRAFLGRADAYRKLEQYDEALQDYRTVVALRPNGWAVTHLAWEQLGRIHFLRREYEAALAVYETAIKAGAKWPYLLRSDVYLAQNQVDQALADIEQALKLSPDNRNAYRRRALIYRAQAKYDLALADLQRIVDAGPAPNAGSSLPATALLMQGQIFLADLNDSRRALEAYAKARELDPVSARTEISYAGALLLCGMADQYRQVCREMLEHSACPTDDDKAIQAVRCCVLGPDSVPDPNQLVTIAEPAVPRNPEQASSIHVLGMAYLRAGQWAQAAESLQNSLSASPEWQANYLNWLALAMVHGARGEAAEAQEWFSQAREWIEQHPIDYASVPDDWVEGELLCREAQTLLSTLEPTQSEGKTEQTGGNGGTKKKNGR